MSSTDFDFFLFSSKKKLKKKIRRIIDDAELGKDTRSKIAIEKVFARQSYLLYCIRTLNISLFLLLYSLYIWFFIFVETTGAP